ncbi:histidine phosphatase family protein [uncultured Cocleimonas sp.]|uniref:histidine phosphatase family protein n=1 Tax=uncultured Cocleimonas sp. TaxID=1051587 RepID=UPI002630CA7F|nr:histidine phosphatase family protein [uncultured Cocleimonas sp.]
MTSTTTIIDLLRHGEVENDAVFCGSTDDVLTDNGWQQMVKSLENKGEWDLIVSASLERCQEFSELIAKEDDIDIEVDESMNEMDFGLWEGLSPEQIMHEEGELLNSWWQSPTKIVPPEGEDFHVFQARVLAYFKHVVDNNQGKRILFVSDTGPIRLIIMYILGMQDENIFRLNVDYACFSRLHIYHDEVGERGCLIQHG